jgi:hypothetical protein
VAASVVVAVAVVAVAVAAAAAVANDKRRMNICCKADRDAYRNGGTRSEYGKWRFESTLPHLE